jgi:hypothetical protein
VVHGSQDKFGGIVNYSNGSAKWGESTNSGNWAGVGTNGGANLVILDASFGVLATFWVQQTIQAMAGAHMLATIMPVTGDTSDVSDRGGFFGNSWAVYPDGATSDAWLTTMNSIPNTGINGGGCNFVIAYDASPDRAGQHLAENWTDLRNDDLDSQGTNYYAARWLCNWSSNLKDRSIFELPRRRDHERHKGSSIAGARARRMRIPRPAGFAPTGDNYTA